MPVIRFLRRHGPGDVSAPAPHRQAGRGVAGRRCRALAGIARANSSFPVPLSPVSRTETSLTAALLAVPTASRIALLCPVILSKP